MNAEYALPFALIFEIEGMEPSFSIYLGWIHIVCIVSIIRFTDRTGVIKLIFMDTTTASRIKNILGVAAILVLAIWLSPFLILLLPFLLYRYLSRKKQRHDVIQQIKREWFSRGKFVFFLYSDSKIWKEYFEKELIPRVKDEAIVWNWSTRLANGWNKELPEAKLLDLFGGGYLYPTAYLVTPEGEVEIFNFHDAYIRFIKSGKPEYKELESRFLERVNQRRAQS